jgi:glycosyltransferase involved in cell wall biosynthesis
MYNIGMLYYMPRNGGGTYQLTENVMSALEDYTKARDTSRIHLFVSARQAEDLGKIKLKYPNFSIHRIGLTTWRFSTALKLVFQAIPQAITCLRYIYPLNWIAHRYQIDLMIFAGITFETSFYKRRQIVLFTDIAHVFYTQFPELVAQGELRRRNILFTYCVRYADQLVVESEQLRNDTVKYYGADASKIAILHQTVSQSLVALDGLSEDTETVEFRRALPKKYLFYPAQLWAHKNHKNLLYAFKILIAEIPDLQLILVGSRKSGDQEIFDLIDKLGIKQNVRWMGYVPDKFIIALYKNARALVKPGYIGPTNIPTLEAFYFGCPAVISDLPGVREQTADAALLFDPNSPQDIAAKTRLILTDETLRRSFIKEGLERLKVLGYDSYKKTLFAILDKNLNLQHDQRAMNA